MINSTEPSIYYHISFIATLLLYQLLYTHHNSASQGSRLTMYVDVLLTTHLPSHHTHYCLSVGLTVPQPYHNYSMIIVVFSWSSISQHAARRQQKSPNNFSSGHINASCFLRNTPPPHRKKSISDSLSRRCFCRRRPYSSYHIASCFPYTY